MIPPNTDKTVQSYSRLVCVAYVFGYPHYPGRESLTGRESLYLRYSNTSELSRISNAKIIPIFIAVINTLTSYLKSFPTLTIHKREGGESLAKVFITIIKKPRVEMVSLYS